MKTFAATALLHLAVFGQVAIAASPFDGAYSGAATWAGNGNRRCNAVPDFKITVRDGRFSYGAEGERVPVVVAPDGSFSAQAGVRFLQGKIAGNQMTATTSGSACNYMWDLHK